MVSAQTATVEISTMLAYLLGQPNLCCPKCFTWSIISTASPIIPPVLHFLKRELLQIRPIVGEMSFASPTLTPAITDLPYMVISPLRAMAHCPKSARELVIACSQAPNCLT